MSITLRPPEPAEPLYAQVESVLSSEILSGVLAPDSQLATEESLMARFQVSRTTVRKAVQNLIARSLLEIRRGKGTFISRPKITPELTQLTGFVEDMEALGHHPTARLLSKETQVASPEVARHLALPPGSMVVRLERIRLADGLPVSFDETYLPLEIGEKVIQHDLDAEPIFTLLEQKYGIPLIEADYRLEAQSSTEHVAQALGIEAGCPLFVIERTTYREGKQPIDYEKLHYRGDLVRFVTRLARKSSATSLP